MEYIYIYYNGRHYLQVQAASDLRGTNRLCGLCGNYNGIALDDPTAIAPLQPCANEIGKRSAPSTAECDDSPSITKIAREKCGVLRSSSIFSVCNAAVDPTPFIKECEFDYCCGNESLREQYFCDVLSAYAATCAENGAQPSNWRSEFCRKFVYRQHRNA